jgi:hypothetical protein
MASELKHHGKDQPEPDDTQSESGQIKRPFDTSGMNWVPEHQEGDPPYRDWWVIDCERDDE